jgi:hypothetical protein
MLTWQQRKYAACSILLYASLRRYCPNGQCPVVPDEGMKWPMYKNGRKIKLLKNLEFGDWYE